MFLIMDILHALAKCISVISTLTTWNLWSFKKTTRDSHTQLQTAGINAECPIDKMNIFERFLNVNKLYISPPVLRYMTDSKRAILNCDLQMLQAVWHCGEGRSTQSVQCITGGSYTDVSLFVKKYWASCAPEYILMMPQGVQRVNQKCQPKTVHCSLR